MFVAAVCKCKPFYSGEDCSLNENEPPTVVALENSGLCHITPSSFCLSVTVYGNNFVEDKAVCHFQKATVSRIY